MGNSLPKNWVETDINTITTILDNLRKPVNSDDRNKRNGDIPYYGATGQTGWIDDYIFDEELILLGEDGAPFFDKTKNVAYLINGKSWVNNHAHVLKGINNILLNKFLLHYLNVFDYTGFVGGTTRLKLNQQFLKSIPFPLPPLAEQQRIVNKLDALFGQLDNIKKSLENVPVLLKNFRQQVLTQAVTGKLTGITHENKVALNDLGTWKGGGTPSKSNNSFWEGGNVLWITPKDMKNLMLSDSIDKITEEAVKNSSTVLIPKNSILIVTRSGILRRTLPISSNSIETTVNQDLKVLIPNSKVYYKYLLYALVGLEENIRNSCMKSGTTVESVEFPLLKNYEINLPSLEEQYEIVRRIESLFAKADAIEAQYITLKEKIDKLPQAILHKAFKGELTQQLDTDGDARDLLKAIEQLKSTNTKTKKNKL